MKNEPAFPTEIREFDHQEVISIHTIPGLTKLEWYSGLAMQGLLMNPSLRNDFFGITANTAIAQAKELIKQLEAEK